jgi:hypothetical protein
MLMRPVRRVGRPGLVGTAARTAVVAGTATAVVGGMSRHQQAKAAEAQAAVGPPAAAPPAAPPPEPAAAPAAPASPPAAAAAEDDTLAQLEKLGQLKAAGVLTEEEFAAQKAKILGG